MEEFEAAHREEMAELIELDALRDRVDQVNTQVRLPLGFHHSDYSMSTLAPNQFDSRQ